MTIPKLPTGYTLVRNKVTGRYSFIHPGGRLSPNTWKNNELDDLLDHVLAQVATSDPSNWLPVDENAR